MDLLLSGDGNVNLRSVPLLRIRSGLALACRWRSSADPRSESELWFRVGLECLPPLRFRMSADPLDCLPVGPLGSLHGQATSARFHEDASWQRCSQETAALRAA